MEPTLYLLDTGMGENIAAGTDRSSAGAVVVASSDGKSMRPLVPNQAHPDGIDISLETNRIFWTDMGNPSVNDGTVWSANLDGSDAKCTVKKGHVHTPKQICIDHSNKKILFCDREGLRIHRCNCDGSEHEIIFQAGDWRDGSKMMDQTLWCVGVAIDADHGVFYWTQKGNAKGGQGRIFRAQIDIKSGEHPNARSDIETLFEGLPEPIDLEIDHDNEVLYWSDRGEYPQGNSLNRAYVGKGVPPEGVAVAPKWDVLTRHFHEAIGLKLDKLNQHIWMTDLGGAVYRIDMDGHNKTRIYDSESCFTGIALAHHGT